MKTYLSQRCGKHDQLHGCATYADIKLCSSLTQKDSMLGFILCCNLLKFLMIFEQAPHFNFVLGPIHYVASPVCKNKIM